jgi:predicted  nucleic acid-binding Zn-ribbon protein
MVKKMNEQLEELQKKFDALEQLTLAMCAAIIDMEKRIKETEKRFDMLGETNNALVSALKMLSK